ncbi:MAG: hypothetical protein ACI9TH_002838 [Kiritimatiellia bacterium]|jgi:hypothetical protein
MRLALPILILISLLVLPAHAVKPVEHWAFEPVGDHQPPEVKQASWIRNPIDRFVLRKLEAAGITPSEPADPRTLVRRVTTGLTGLAPSYDEAKTFADDPSAAAYTQVLDRLLHSTAYGQTWGRHWLDVARYADTRGYLTGGQETRFPYSYTYRDYVIRAFNEDKPYDQFIIEQLAADQLDTSAEPRTLAAMGFLTVGRRFLNKTPEIIDDRIDVVTRGFMGLTVYCARCHDHKYDPILTADYYALYGIFDNSHEPKELPVIEKPGSTPGYATYKEEHDKRVQAVEDLKHKQHEVLHKELNKTLGDYLKEWVRQEYPEHFKLLPEPAYLKENRLRKHAQATWKTYFSKRAKQADPVLSILPVLGSLPLDQFASQAEARIRMHKPMLPDLQERLLAAPHASLDELINTYAVHWSSGEIPGFKEAFLADQTPLKFPFTELNRYQDRKMREEITKLEKKIIEWESASPDAPARAMVLNDVAQPHPNYVFLRGNEWQRGPQVSRRFPAVLQRDDEKAYTQGSGRLELARSIADPQNPLTYRVLVNRVWQFHFGRGLVDTPDDFGTRGAQPSHPELLDYLTTWFIKHDKSIKRLHRFILDSATYRQASISPNAVPKNDTENRLLSRMNRQRLSMEAMRDQLMQAAGKLDVGVGGRSVDLWKQPYSTRRSVYGFVDRQEVPGVFRTFDFANPDSVTGQRPVTTVPQQALFNLNSPYIQEMAAALTARSVSDQPDTRIQALYRFALARDPDESERTSAHRFLEGGDEKRWQSFAQVLLMSNEFTFID